MVRVLLISPGKSWRPDANFGDCHLVALGSYLQKECDATVEVIDLDYERRLTRPARERIFSRDFQVICISCYSSYDYLSTFYLGKEIRERNKNAILVTGGYHPSARPGDFVDTADSELEEPSPFDHAIIGEGELPLAKIVDAAARGERLADKVLGPQPVPLLDDLPPLDWSLLDRYRRNSRTIGGQVNLSITRGCPFHCSFCMERAKGEAKWRAWSPERAEEEIRRLASWLDRDDWKLFLADPVFGLKPDWRREMLDRLAKRDLGFERMWTLCRVDILQPGDIERFHRAGLAVGFGLESGDPEMLQRIEKTSDVSRFYEAFHELARESAAIGFPWGANIIVGHPGETPESMERSAKFVRELYLGTKNLTGFLSVDPYRFYPGSAVDRRLDEYEERFGTRVHRPRWWNYSEQAFNSEWIDPSVDFDYHERERLTAELFEPITRDIAEHFSYRGPDQDYFQRSVMNACEAFEPTRRLRTLTNYHLWRRLSGEGESQLIDDPTAAAIFRRLRRHSVSEIRRKFVDILDVSEDIIEALIDEPRERYVPSDSIMSSYQDQVVPLLADGTATVSAMHAYLLMYGLVDLQEGDHLLEVGGGTGFGAGVASRVVGPNGDVTSYEIVSSLAQAAIRNLSERENVTMIDGSGLSPDPVPPFNKAVFSCSLRRIPQLLLDALPEGGRLVAPIFADGEDWQMLTLYMRVEGRIVVSEHCPVRYVTAVERR